MKIYNKGNKMGLLNSSNATERIIQESVPGKQVTIAHVIASPTPDIYERLGIDDKGAIGILTLSPYETAIIAADIVIEIGRASCRERV